MGPAADGPEAVRAEELTAIVREVRERVRARYPETSAGPVPVPLADLMPVVHARDAAQAKVAAIGGVNPRPGGPVNALIQAVKKTVARALDWHVREQVEFNREAVACVEALTEALNEVNRALVRVGEQMGAQAKRAAELEAEARELADVRRHWAEWRVEWERKLAANEAAFLRNAAEMQSAYQHRATLMEGNFRDLFKTQHADFTAALARSAEDVQRRFWGEVEKVRLEYERTIHAELRVMRQRAAAGGAGVAPPAAAFPGPAAPALDWLAFAQKFRGPRESVLEKQRFYLPYFQGRKNVLDLGCGRGEFLELMREAGTPARGVDGNRECVAMCRAQGLEAEEADLFAFLEAEPEGSLGGIFCAQVVEHLPPERLPELVALAASRLQPGGVCAIETPNPECLAIFAVHFFLDPTHTRPVPHPLLAFYFEEAGLGAVEVHKLSPAVESMPAVAGLPEEFRNAFFGGLDYAIVGRRL